VYWVVTRRADSTTADRQIFLPVEVGFYVLSMITYGIICVFCVYKVAMVRKTPSNLPLFNLTHVLLLRVDHQV